MSCNDVGYGLAKKVNLEKLCNIEVGRYEESNLERADGVKGIQWDAEVAPSTSSYKSLDSSKQRPSGTRHSRRRGLRKLETMTARKPSFHSSYRGKST